MKQIYHPYWLWEDFNNGMWRKESKLYELNTFDDIVEFTGNHVEYGIAMMEVIERWPYTMEHNLTNSSINHRAFIGHSACSYKFDWPEYLVRKAWKHLSKEQQDLANDEAEKAFKLWCKMQDRSLRQNMGGQVLF